jgi:transcriptional regulator with XRE-family HTH domain
MGKKLGKKPLKARFGHRKPRPLTNDEQTFMQAFGLAIKSRRLAAQITGEELGRRVGTGTPTQFHRESGRLGMSLVELFRYSTALRCKPSEILKDAERLLPTIKGPTKGRTRPGGKRSPDAGDETRAAGE